MSCRIIILTVGIGRMNPWILAFSLVSPLAKHAFLGMMVAADSNQKVELPKMY